MNAAEIIRRCTRNGVTAWQAVAQQLGQSVDRVRAQHDPTYMRAYIAMPERGPRPEMAVDPADIEVPAPADRDIPTNSPHIAAIPLKVLILRTLQHGALSAETISCVLIRPVNSIRARLDRLQGDLLVCHDGRFPRSWSLTAMGLRIAVTGCEVRAKERA